MATGTSIPLLNIVILVVGTRGDVQPFIAFGQALRQFDHRVRLATHQVHRRFVLRNDLEFSPLAGNPDELVEYVIRNGGIFRKVPALLNGDVRRQRETITEILSTTWNACTVDDPETGVPFTADAIITNPPSYGHIYCAEKLGIPLHMVFTMPWSKTVRFPHPFAGSKNNRIGTELDNKRSYDEIEKLVSSILIQNIFY